MPIISFTGNLTTDPALKQTQDGRKYYLLQVAENIRKKDESGNYIKDDAGHYVNAATYYHSVFVNDHALCFEAQELKKGDPVYVKGIAKIKEMHDANSHPVYKLDRIVATLINNDPFKTNETMATESQIEEEAVA